MDIDERYYTTQSLSFNDSVESQNPCQANMNLLRTHQYIQQPRFQGHVATEVTKHHWVAPEDVSQICRHCDDGDPYVGEVPQDVLEASGWKENEIKSFLDALGGILTHLKGYNTAVQPSPINPRFVTDAAQEAGLAPTKHDSIPNVINFDSGSQGRIFILEWGEHQYVLKNIRYSNPEDLYYNVKQDIPNLAYATALGVVNIPQFILGNIEKGWVLMEYINEDLISEGRPGKHLSDHGFSINDPWRDNGNVKGDFILDMGLMHDSNEKRAALRSDQELSQLVEPFLKPGSHNSFKDFY